MNKIFYYYFSLNSCAMTALRFADNTNLIPTSFARVLFYDFDLILNLIHEIFFLTFLRPLLPKNSLLFLLQTIWRDKLTQ